MKVLITTDWYKPAINGVVTSVINLADGLTAMGVEVRILTLSEDHHSHVDGNVTYIGSVGADKIYPDARLKLAPSGKYLQQLIEWKPDIVHSQCEFSTFHYAKKIAAVCNCPFVHTYHTVYEDFTHYFSPNIKFGKYMTAAFSKRVLAKTDSVIAPTAKVRDMLCRYGVDEHIAVIPSGLDLTRFESKTDNGEKAKARNELRRSLGINDDDRVLLFLGRLAKEKNIEELLFLTAGLAYRHIKLLLVGDGVYRRELEAKASELDLGDRVIFTGMIDPDDVAAYYAAGDVFVSASKSETQGLTYIEAMAAGLPLLCREDPCLAEVIEDGVNGLTYTDSGDFSQKLYTLLDDDSMRSSLGAKARETVFDKFSSTGFARNVLQEYKNCLCTSQSLLTNEQDAVPAKRTKEEKKQLVFKGISAFSLIAAAALCIYGWHTGLFASQDSFQSFVAGFGIASALVFVVFQAVQVVFPVLPGGISCLAGVLMFGSWTGFLYNYIGICIGSVLAFLIAKNFGKPILKCFFKQKLIDKYDKWTSEKNRFNKLFAVAIFMPVAPDDFLCYLAGTTQMSLSRFTTIILLGKPLSIALYSLGLTVAFAQIPALLNL